MITDPKTIPASRNGRRAYAIGVGLLATLLIAPQTTEFGTKVAILAALAVVCGARGVIELAGTSRAQALTARLVAPRRVAVAGAAIAGALVYAGLVVAAGIPARPGSAGVAAADVGALPEIVVIDSAGVAIDASAAQVIARDVLVALEAEAEALRLRDIDRAGTAASGAWLASLWERIRAASGQSLVVPTYDVESMQLSLHRGAYQGPPTVVARLVGTVVASTHGPGRATVASRGPEEFVRTVHLALERGQYRIVRSEGGVSLAAAGARAPGSARVGSMLEDVAADVGLDFRHGAFRFGMSFDSTAMMGGGVCWLDYDRDGWLDLFVVNSYAQADASAWEAKGGLPRSALYRNVRGRFVDVSADAGADLPVRGNGCVAADLDLDGHTDLYVTTAGYNVATDGYDALLWNDGAGSFTEGARAAGINAIGWHAGAAVGDVNGDGLPDLFVASYTDPNWPLPASASGFPTNHKAVRDLLYLNLGDDGAGRPRFREVAKLAGIERQRVGHGLGAVFTDFDRDGRLDLYVANDADPNQLYENVAWPGGASADPAGLGFRFEEAAKRHGVDDPNAGMGIAAADFSLDGLPDMFVTNSREQLHAAYRSRPSRSGRAFADARPDIAAAFGARSTGWGATWADLNLDADLDLVVANGAIPVLHLAKDAQRVQVLENVGRSGGGARFAPDGRDPRACRRGQRPRTRGGRLRQRRGRRRRSQLDRRTAPSPREPGSRPLARGPARPLRSGSPGHGRAPGRPTARSRGARRQQLPLLRGPPRALRSRRGDQRRAAGGALPRRQRGSPARRRGRSARRRRAVASDRP